MRYISKIHWTSIFLLALFLVWIVVSPVLFKQCDTALQLHMYATRGWLVLTAIVMSAWLFLSLVIEFNYRNNKDKKARWRVQFLLIVLVFFVIALLVMIASLNTARGKSIDAARYSDQKIIELALEFYYKDFGKYPERLSDLNPDYIFDPMTDPITQEQYEYGLSEDGNTYVVKIVIDRYKSDCQYKYEYGNYYSGNTTEADVLGLDCRLPAVCKTSSFGM